MIDPCIRLRRAILLNDVLLVQRIISNHPQLLENTDFDNRSNTNLHLAATNGCTGAAEHLIKAGHDAQEISRNVDHDTPLMLAAQHGHLEFGLLLVKNFPRSIPLQNQKGLDALALASQNPNSTSLIPALLQHPEFPASVNTRDNDGNTALHHASASGSLKALRILLGAGANPSSKNNYDWVPLAYSQTVAAEVYFKNLVAELERRKAEGAKQVEEREKARAAGVRLVDDEGVTSKPGGDADEEELIDDALKRHWSPVERKRTNVAAMRHEWGSAMSHTRNRSGS